MLPCDVRARSSSKHRLAIDERAALHRLRSLMTFIVDLECVQREKRLDGRCHTSSAITNASLVIAFAVACSFIVELRHRSQKHINTPSHAPPSHQQSDYLVTDSQQRLRHHYSQSQSRLLQAITPSSLQSAYVGTRIQATNLVESKKKPPRLRPDHSSRAIACRTARFEIA